MQPCSETEIPKHARSLFFAGARKLHMQLPGLVSRNYIHELLCARTQDILGNSEALTSLGILDVLVHGSVQASPRSTFLLPSPLANCCICARSERPLLVCSSMAKPLFQCHILGTCFPKFDDFVSLRLSKPHIGAHDSAHTRGSSTSHFQATLSKKAAHKSIKRLECMLHGPSMHACNNHLQQLPCCKHACLHGASMLAWHNMY